MNGLTAFDVIVIAILAFMAIRGGLSGFTSQVVSFVAIIVGWIVAARCHGLVSPLLPLDDPWNRYAAMVLLFLGIWVGSYFLQSLLSSALKKMQIKEFDRQLGALVGLLKGLFVCMVVTFFAVSLSEMSRQYVLASKSGHYLAILIDKTGAMVPGELSSRLSAQLDQFRRRIAEERSGEAEEQGIELHASGEGEGAESKTKGLSFLSHLFSFSSGNTAPADSGGDGASPTQQSSIQGVRHLVDTADQMLKTVESIRSPQVAPVAPLVTTGNVPIPTVEEQPLSKPQPLRGVAAPTTVMESAPAIPKVSPISQIPRVMTLSNETPPPMDAFISIGEQNAASSVGSSSPAFDPQAWAKALQRKN